MKKTTFKIEVKKPPKKLFKLAAMQSVSAQL